jgi:hypothetical protein
MKIKNVSHAEFLQTKGDMCAWNGCSAHVKGDLPSGWLHLFTYEAPRPMLDIFKQRNFHRHRRDGVLCPQHAFMLEQMLKPLPAKPGEEIDAPDFAQ